MNQTYYKVKQNEQSNDCYPATIDKHESRRKRTSDEGYITIANNETRCTPVCIKCHVYELKPQFDLADPTLESVV